MKKSFLLILLSLLLCQINAQRLTASLELLGYTVNYDNSVSGHIQINTSYTAEDPTDGIYIRVLTYVVGESGSEYPVWKGLTVCPGGVMNFNPTFYYHVGVTAGFYIEAWSAQMGTSEQNNYEWERIVYTVPAPPDLSSPWINGPVNPDFGVTCHYEVAAYPFGGVPPYSYRWYAQEEGASSQQVGTGYSLDYTVTDTIDVYCIVEDGLGREATSNTITTSPIIDLIASHFITGPSTLPENVAGNFVSTISGGEPSFHYDWQMRIPTTLVRSLDNEHENGIGVRSIPGGYWFSVGPDNWNVDLSSSSDFDVRCIVTDAADNSMTSNTLNVNVTGQSSSQEVSSETGLLQNHPNPFNPTTIIKYSLSEASNVSLKVYNTLGEEVAVLCNQFKSQGEYQATFNAENLPSGVYIYRLETANYTEIRKMILTK